VGLWRFHQEVDVLLMGPAFDGLVAEQAGAEVG
jgi:hypothetical protein